MELWAEPLLGLQALCNLKYFLPIDLTIVVRAPEVSKGVYTEKADGNPNNCILESNFVRTVWSFGCLIFELLTLNKSKGTPLVLPKDLAKELNPIIDLMKKCTSVAPADRPNSS